MSITRKLRTPIQHRVVRDGNTIYIGGAIADDTTKSMGEQTRNILQKFETYLHEGGSDRDHVLTASIFVTDLSKKKEMDEAWIAFFGDNLPARATVGVADLGGRALIEVVMTARVKG
jgi:2-iminobutanoate/2-iminopropanoate deaminase